MYRGILSGQNLLDPHPVQPRRNPTTTRSIECVWAALPPTTVLGTNANPDLTLLATKPSAWRVLILDPPKGDFLPTENNEVARTLHSLRHRAGTTEFLIKEKTHRHQCLWLTWINHHYYYQYHCCRSYWSLMALGGGGTDRKPVSKSVSRLSSAGSQRPPANMFCWQGNCARTSLVTASKLTPVHRWQRGISNAG